MHYANRVGHCTLWLFVKKSMYQVVCLFECFFFHYIFVKITLLDLSYLHNLHDLS